MSAITAERLFKIFGPHPERALEPLRAGEDRDEVHRRTGQLGAVVDVSFTVEPGEFFVVMGLSGSGKSTLVRMINYLHPPTAGTVKIDGQDVGKLKADELRELRSTKISMVFQSFALFPHRTVIENAGYGLEVRKVPVEERRERARAALDTVGLGGWEDKRPHELSGGMRQRVGLARALATDAPIMLMDEPFSALDPLIRRDIQGQLLELQRELKKTIVFITHDLNEAMRLGDRIAVMKDGAVVQNDTPEEILNNPADTYVADFIQDVDRSRVLTAGTVMVDPIVTVSPRHGPKVAMLEMKAHHASDLYVTDKGQRLVGAIRDHDLSEASNRGASTIEEFVHHEYRTVEPDTSLLDILQLAADQQLPVAVVEDGRLVGVLPRALILSTLGAHGDGADPPEPDVEGPSTEAEDTSHV
jgi:glycine betaine/proline transport system ATP-binding protein